MKKTNIPIYIMYLWAALVLAACTGDDDAAWPEGGVPLELYAAVEGYSSANAQTRATTENRWEGGERVRLWISSSFSGPAQDVYSSVDSDGKLIMNGALSNWVSPDEEKGIQGLYPLSRNIVSFSVQADQRDEGYQDSDCMAAPYLRIAVTSPDKTLVFRHVIAKVVVHLKAGNGVTDDELQRATVTFENLTCTGGSIDFSNGTAGQVTPRHRPHHPQRSDPCRRRIRTHRARPASSPEQVGTEVRENSHRRKDLLLHPRRRRSGLLQWQDVRVPPHRDLGRYRKYRRGRRRRRYVASGRVEQ